MSGTTEPEVHVDTPEQAAARQLIETSQRVTHVHIEPPPVEPEDPPIELSLTALVHKEPKQKAKAAVHVQKEDKK